MNKKLIALAVAAAAASSSVHALEVYNDGTNTFSVGGRLAASARFSDGDSELRNQSSRINFGYTHALESGWDIGTRAEWAYDALANSSEGSHISNRLGYITADNEDFGHFTLGKAWSVHYDVTGKTDRFWIYGGNTAGNYDGISGDGGVHGTGRADDVIQYRNNFYGVQIGLQYQFQDSNLKRNNDGNVIGGYDRDYGYQAMAGYDVDTGMGILGLSGVYGETKFDDREDAKVANAVISYEYNGLNLAANYGEFRNHQSETSNDAFKKSNFSSSSVTAGGMLRSATGVELFASYDINQFQILGGYNQLEDDNSKAKFAYATLGAAYFTGPIVLAAEYKIDTSSKTDTGADAKLENELGLLVRYNF
ncbi:porin [Photobacterium lutimaris]|uniref:Porin n=1 Tax=Photobacterium lutimaris TaxID=388278 RepID=A0A2T3J190_9GAMM|nr:porin [Photobacterium lutimaris]PSU34836.1 porin [Photobacterium lutimaris]TDR77170.1 putative porin [Photobacterium lutimaris]